MRKFILSLMVGMLLAGSALTASAANEGRGGFMGFVAGCCFGIRTGAAYNDGKEINWREWLTLIPGICIWNGVDGANGMTTADYVNAYGISFF